MTSTDALAASRRPAAAPLDGRTLVAHAAARHRRRALRHPVALSGPASPPCRWCCSGAPTPSPTASSRSAPRSWARARHHRPALVAGDHRRPRHPRRPHRLLRPGLTGGILLIFIAIWAIAIGVMAIVGAIQLRKEIEGEWLLILSGALAILFGVLMFLQPAAGALAGGLDDRHLRDHLRHRPDLARLQAQGLQGPGLIAPRQFAGRRRIRIPCRPAPAGLAVASRGTSGTRIDAPARGAT